MKIKLSESENAPLQSIEEWEDDLLVRYPEPKDKQAKAKDDYRNYHDSEKVDTVRQFYKLNHTYQTYDFVLEKEKEYLKFKL